MKIVNEEKIMAPDYRRIRELSHRTDCTVTQADFNTSRPNPYRIEYIASDIHRYLKYTGEEFYGFNC